MHMTIIIYILIIRFKCAKEEFFVRILNFIFDIN